MDCKYSHSLLGGATVPDSAGPRGATEKGFCLMNKIQSDSDRKKNLTMATQFELMQGQSCKNICTWLLIAIITKG